MRNLSRQGAPQYHLHGIPIIISDTRGYLRRRRRQSERGTPRDLSGGELAAMFSRISLQLRATLSSRLAYLRVLPYPHLSRRDITLRPTEPARMDGDITPWQWRRRRPRSFKNKTEQIISRKCSRFALHETPQHPHTAHSRDTSVPRPYLFLQYFISIRSSFSFFYSTCWISHPIFVCCFRLFRQHLMYNLIFTLKPLTILFKSDPGFNAEDYNTMI